MLETSAVFFQITQPFAWTSHAKGVKRENNTKREFVNFSCALKRENMKTWISCTVKNVKTWISWISCTVKNVKTWISWISCTVKNVKAWISWIAWIFARRHTWKRENVHPEPWKPWISWFFGCLASKKRNVRGILFPWPWVEWLPFLWSKSLLGFSRP